MSVPKLRFSEFSQEWNPAKASDAFNSRRTKGEEGVPIYSVTLDRGMVRRDTLDRKILDDAADGANLWAQRGDLVYNMMRMWQGAVGQAPEDCMVSPAYVVLSPKAQTSAEFFNHWFKSKRIIYLLWAYSQGLTSDRLRLYFKDFAQIPLHLPRLAEQTKIANFLTAVDEKITQLTKKCSLLTQYKKGVMQQIFSQELRFKDDEGRDFPEWDETPLESVLDYLQPTKHLVSSTVYADHFSTPVLTAGKSFILGFTDEVDGVFKDNLPVIIFDDFTTAFKFVNFSFKAKSSAMKILCAKNEFVNIKYVFEAMQLIDFPCGAEHKRYWISEYSKQTIPLPISAEQTKIANFLTAIDDKIAHAQTQLAAAKQFKQGLLQQMFV